MADVATPSQAQRISSGLNIATLRNGGPPNSLPIPTTQARSFRNQQLAPLDTLSPVTQYGSFEFDRIIKQGEVHKRTRKTKSWKPIFIVLRPNILSIYRDQQETKLRHQVNLSELTAVARQKDQRRKDKHVFALFSPSRNYHLEAASDKEAQEWVEKIREAARIDEQEEEMILQSPGGASESRYQGFERSIDAHISPQTAESTGGGYLSSSDAENLSPNHAIPVTKVRDKHASTNYSVRRPSYASYSGAEGHGSYSDFSEIGGPTSRLSALSLSGADARPSTSSTQPAPTSAGAQARPSVGMRSASQMSNLNLPTSQQKEEDSERVVHHSWIYLLKSHRGVRQWKKVWLVVRPKGLAFYKGEDEYAALLILPLNMVIDVVEIDPISKSKRYCMQIISEERNYRFCCQDEESLTRCLGSMKSLLSKQKQRRKEKETQGFRTSMEQNIVLAHVDHDADLPMFAFLRLRSQAELDDLCAAFGETLNAGVLDRLEKIQAHEFGIGDWDMSTYHTMASPASLRSKEAVDVVERPFTPTGGDAGNVKVVVRVRKFIRREIEKQQPCIVEMNPANQETTLHPPTLTPDEAKSSRKTYEEKKFTFDKSFWSHQERDAHYAQQHDIYASFGEEFLDHNFDGYHTCIFAYGQTGSGKSYTMMGTLDQPGLIPRTCRGLFERIEAEQNGSITYNVHVSYFEIYNEHVKDLLAPRSTNPTYLKIRESKSDGVYVQNLTDEPVKCYEDIERLMKTGDMNRTTASTKMNDTSSRSHAVFTLTLKQIQHDIATDSTIERLARMRLVDLAGSERANRTEATGQRLREGGNINQSLTTLGRVIAALADPKRQRASRMTGLQNQSKRRAEVVPYRDSVLTWLLKDSLGGNSKTAMVACISPTDYEETLSTLRYADQAKRIRTKAHVNQDAVSAAERDAKILEMQETIKALQLSVNNAAVRKRDEADRARDELEDYQRQVTKMQRAMEESRAVSDVKIRALTMEVEELRPQNAALQLEIEALRRHLALAVGELKNPIVLPEGVGDGENEDPREGDGSDSGMGDELSEEGEGAFEHEEWQADVDALLKDLGVFKRKVADDKVRFPHEGAGRSVLGEVSGNV